MKKNESTPAVQDFKFSCEVEVRFRDLDAMGHVNNAVYFTFFEIARTGYMQALGHYSDKDDLFDLYPFILLDVQCRYLSAAVLSERLVVHLRTVRIGNKSYQFEYLITAKADNRPVGVGRSTQVYYSYQQQKTLPIPDAFRQCIEKLEARSFDL
ncbi:MAG: acyl-CoA thioesterase [Deltaproteobacteria bacterium]|nr:acyl-CoA thioesterase [Deltaproteobacteria bacterium]